jgi:hypothetical protein
MAMKLEDLKKLLDKEGLRYFVAPDRPAILLGFSGMFGHYQVVMTLELDGTFMQFRTVRYLHCPQDHPHLLPMLKVLGHIDYTIRLLKYGWDPSDGEIVGYVDEWVTDGKPSQAQFSRMVQSFVSGIDSSYDRIKRTIETGEDPGAVDPAALLERLMGGGMPDEIRRMVEEAKRKAAGEGPGEGKKKKDEDEEEEEPITEV